MDGKEVVGRIEVFSASEHHKDVILSELQANRGFRFSSSTQGLTLLTAFEATVLSLIVQLF